MSWLSVAIHWTDEHSGAVQAVGSIFAIVAGFTAVFWQRQREEDEAKEVRAMQATALAARLLPYVDAYQRELASVIKGPGDIPSVDLPREIVNASSELYVFKEAAPSVILLFREAAAAAIMRKSNDELNTFDFTRVYSVQPDLRARTVANIYQNALEVAQTASSELEIVVHGLSTRVQAVSTSGSSGSSHV